MPKGKALDNDVQQTSTPPPQHGHLQSMAHAAQEQATTRDSVRLAYKSYAIVEQFRVCDQPQIRDPLPQASKVVDRATTQYNDATMSRNRKERRLRANIQQFPRQDYSEVVSERTQKWEARLGTEG